MRSMVNGRIVEIFRSIQGEGPYAGVAQAFVRLFECNMHCVWCDTPQSIGDGKKEFITYTPEELFKAIGPLTKNIHSVSITGGEPLIQVDFLKAFLTLLKKHKFTTHLDTNGTLPENLRALLPLIDIIAMDMKLPSSTRQKAFWKE